VAQTPAQEQTNPSAIKVQPGGQAIKEKDLYAKTGYTHPFIRMPKYVAYDQKEIWTSPFHTAKSDIKWWAIFGAATAGLIASDQYIERQLPNTNAQVRIGNYASNLGAAYTLIPISAGFYFIGTAKGSEHFRETGLLCFETLIDVNLVGLVVKSATDRARPTESNGRGLFWDSPNPRYGSSFASGHAMSTWGLASVFAHEYPHKKWIKVLIAAYAGSVVGARLAARKHFPSDTVSGAALGWFMGDYVYARRHNPELDKHSVMSKVLDHVHLEE
jgi:membrane-associated phospholipid phosphatase